MASKEKKYSVSIIGTKPLINVDPSLPEFENHPFFEKKAQKVKALIKSVGLPKLLVRKNK
ncbi:MAG: hypothetical protein WCH78_10860 [Bacteroidota bacterium]|jgi:hypothetical protein